MSTELSLLAMLLLAHVLGDFYCQPYAWIQSRNQRHFKSYSLYLHALIHGMLTLLVFIMFSKVSLIYAMGLSAVIAVTHALIDVVKSYSKQGIRSFTLDQVAHLLVLVMIWALATNQPLLKWLNVSTISYKNLAIAVAYLVVLKPTSIVLKMLLRPWTDKLNIATNAQAPHQSGSLESAGEHIGYLERVLILTFILLNQFSAIGFLLAAKSIFRFGDLTRDKDKKLTEYVMLGTLSSFTITIFIGLLAAAIATQLPVGK